MLIQVVRMLEGARDLGANNQNQPWRLLPQCGDLQVLVEATTALHVELHTQVQVVIARRSLQSEDGIIGRADRGAPLTLVDFTKEIAHPHDGIDLFRRQP
jgi:hypothetical protein